MSKVLDLRNRNTTTPKNLTVTSAPTAETLFNKIKALVASSLWAGNDKFGFIQQHLPLTRTPKFKRCATAVMAVFIIAGLLIWLWPAEALGRPTVIEQQINLVNCPGSGTIAQACNTTSSTDVPTNGALGIVRWDSNQFGGDIMVYFEAVLSNGTGTTTATLYDYTTGTAITASAVAPDTAGLQRLRSGNIAGNLTSGNNLTVRFKSSSGTGTLQAARLVVIQTFNSGHFTSTQTSVDIGNNTTTTSSSFVDVPAFKIWKYEAGKYDGDLKFYLEGTLWTNGNTRNGFMRLLDITTGAAIPMTTAAGGACSPDASSICVRGQSPTLVRGEFTAGLADGHEYKVQIRTSAGTTSTSLARIVIDQKPVIDQRWAPDSTLNGASFNVGDGAANTKRAQAFVVSKTGYYSGFSTELTKVGSPTDLLSITMHDGLDGSKVAEFLVSPSTIAGGITPSVYDYYPSQPVWLSSGTTYYLQFQRTGTLDSNNYFRIFGHGFDSYPAGSSCIHNGTSWSCVTSTDYFFYIYRDYPTKLQTLQQSINTQVSQSSTSYNATAYKIYFDPSNFVNTKNAYYFEVTLLDSLGDGTAYSNLRDITTPGDIPGSEVTNTTVTLSRQRSGDLSAAMPASAKEMDTQTKTNGTQAVARSSWLVIDINVGPTISAITPNKGPIAAGTPITIYGSGFRPSATVTIGGSSATEVFVVSSGQINVKAPASTAGAKDVVITNSDGSTETFKNSYTYEAATFAVTKSDTADFTSGTLSNLSTSGVQNDMANWLWLNSTGSTTGGSIAAGTYYYAVTATDSHGNETARGPESRGVVTTGSTSSVSLKWRTVSGATGYKLYRTTTSGTYSSPALIATITSITGSDSVTYTDTAASASSGAPPGSNGTGGEMSFSYGTVPASGAGTFTAGSAVVGTASSLVGGGAHAIQRPDGKFLIILGDTSNTSIYDPVANTFAAGPAVVGTSGNNASWGSHSLQRPDGKILVILGSSTSNTSIYDPVANTFAAGPAVVGTSGNNVLYGAHSLQRPDGKFLVILGNNTSNTSVYDPVANTFAAGAAVVGTSGSLVNAGAHSLQRPDGKYLLILGNTTSNTSIYDAGWYSGTTAQNGTIGTYTSEALSPTAIASWSKLSWQQTADNDINKVEVRTATSSGGLSSASYRIVSNGGDIGAANGEVWAQVKITYIRTVRTHGNTHSGNMVNVWVGESATHSNRKFDSPNISSLTATYAKLQVTSVAPSAGPTGGGTPFTLTGTGFEKGATVTIGGAAASEVFVVSSTTLTGLAPSGTAGARDIVVTNPTAGLSATLTGGFTYIANYDHHIKTATADFTASGSSLTNVSASGIKIDEGVFQWLESTASTTGGSLAAGTYYYAVTATDFNGGETARGVESRGVVTTGSTSSVSLKWRPVPGATGYNLYRTTTSGAYSSPALIATISAANSSTVQAEISYTDTAANPSSGAPGTNTTNGEIQMNRGTVPASGAGTFTAGPAVDGIFGDAVSYGAFSLQRPDGKFLVILGGTSLNTSIYDPVANTFTAGPTLVGSTGNAAAPGSGAHAIERPDGKFLVIVGAATADTSIYDPVANTFAAGPATPGVNSFGAHSIKRSDGRFLVVRGNQTSNTSIYDPISNTFDAGPPIIGTASNTAYSGAHSIQRPDGKFLVVLGDVGSSTSIYDPTANTFTAGPAIVGTSGNNAYVGAHSIQRPDGRFLLVLGNRSSNTSIYDPLANTFVAGPALAGGAYSQADSGAHSLQRPDGKYLVIIADGSASSSIYDPVANTFTAGPAVVGTSANNVYNGAHSLQRPDGKYLLVLGSSTANTSIYDAGWLTGTTAQNGIVGTYTSEPINPNCASTLDKISWTRTGDGNIQASDNTLDNIEIRTATSSSGLSSATYRNVANGGAINAGVGEVWIQYKVTFRRDVPDWSRADHPAKVWLGESSTVENRAFATPTISSITTTFNVGGGGTNPNLPTNLGQLHSDGTTTIATGAGTSEDKTVIQGTLTTSLATDTLTLQVEIQPIGTPFTGTPNYTSSSIPCSGGTCASGVTGTITITNLVPGSYHWQARTLSASGCSGTPGQWQSAPTPTPNAESDTDFQVLATSELLRHGKHFIDGALRPACESGFCR